MSQRAPFPKRFFPKLEKTNDEYYHRTPQRMPMPDSQTLLLPILRLFADDREHSIEEIRERMRVQFSVAPDELLQKHPNGNPVFHVNVALALANLQGAPHGGSRAIDRVVI